MEICNKHVHKVISRFEYFRQIFESKTVLVKQRTVLDAESNFESNGSLKFSIKKSFTIPKKLKNYIFLLKIRHKLRILA